MISEIGHRYTIGEFEAFIHQPENQERRFELIDGALVERQRTEEHDIIVAYLAMYVGNFVIKRGLGRIVLAAYRHAPDDAYNDLLPDISFTLRERLVPLVEQGAVPQIPDLVIEVPSRGENPDDFQTKAAYYLTHGAQTIWLAHPAARSVAVCTQDGARLVRKGDMLDGGKVLPGFKLPVKDIFEID